MLIVQHSLIINSFKSKSQIYYKSRFFFVLIDYPDLQLTFTESRLGVVASDIVEFDTIPIKVVQDCTAIFVTHTVVGLGASVTEKEKVKINFIPMIMLKQNSRMLVKVLSGQINIVSGQDWSHSQN